MNVSILHFWNYILQQISYLPHFFYATPKCLPKFVHSCIYLFICTERFTHLVNLTWSKFTTFVNFPWFSNIYLYTVLLCVNINHYSFFKQVVKLNKPKQIDICWSYRHMESYFKILDTLNIIVFYNFPRIDSHTCFVYKSLITINKTFKNEMHYFN